MELFGFDTDYGTAIFAFKRALGLIYLVAFVVAVRQFRPLLGEDGLEPVSRFTSVVPFARSPSLFYLHYSDRAFAIIAWAGVALAIAAATGIADAGPLTLSLLVWFLLWALYLSIVNVGQTFYSFGWETLLLETGFLAIFLGPSWMAPPLVVVWLLRWLLFRVELGAGLIKMRGDPCWRDLTCLEFHHETQPMPGPFSRSFHTLPRWMHKIETAGNHVVQLGVIWFVFAPQPIAAVAGMLVIVSQGWLVASGNFSWLNFLTMALALSTFSDATIATVLPVAATAGGEPAPFVFTLVTWVLAVLIAALSVRPVRNLFSRRQRMNTSFEPLHLVNTYGAFGSVTRKRYEIVIEGSDDPNGSSGAEWKAYEFKGKPGDVTRRPRQYAPYHLRLDWQMWFAALSPGYPEPWLVSFVQKLLENDAGALSLLRHNPFPGHPPRTIRALVYLYRFTTPSERKETGHFWKRTYVAPYLPPMTAGGIDEG